MRRVVSVAVALTIAAAPNVAAGTARPKVATDGREELHVVDQQPHDLFGSKLRRHWLLPDISDLRDLTRPPWLRKRSNAESSAPEALHMEELNFLYFSGADVWRHWAFSHTGLLWSPAGLYNEGFTLKLLLNAGAFGYRAGSLDDANVIGRQYSVTAMPGWRIKRSSYEFTVFLGAELQNFTLTPVDPQSRLIGRYITTRMAIEVWWEPTATTMVAADASASMIGAGNYARVAFGLRMFDRFYLGPEAQIYSTEPYYHRRAGVHITAFKADGREWSGAIGLASDSSGRTGTYVRINVLTRL